MFGFTEEEIAQFGLTFGVSAFMLYMVFIIFQLARESKAGRFGTFVLFLALGFGLVGFAAKSVIKFFIGGSWSRLLPAACPASRPAPACAAIIGAMDTTAMPAPARHTLVDDAQGLITGCLVVALSLLLMRQAGLVTGGTAGIALVAHYALGAPFGLVFFVVNLPFYVLAWKRMGRAFTLKTLAAVATMSLLSEALPQLLSLRAVDPLFAAVGGGMLAGVGLLILFRHRASLGGLNVMVLWLQELRGWRAGRTQGVIDVAILLASSHWLSWQQLGLSVLAAVALNFVLAINHRPDRYVGF